MGGCQEITQSPPFEKTRNSSASAAGRIGWFNILALRLVRDKR